MSKHKQQQITLSKRLCIVIGVLVAVLGAGTAGWCYWYNNYAPHNYLTIKEWGVRFKLPRELRGDVTYRYYKSPNSDIDYSMVTLGSKQLKAEAKELKLHYERMGGIGTAIDRSLPNQDYRRDAPLRYQFSHSTYKTGRFKTIGQYDYSVEVFEPTFYRRGLLGDGDPSGTPTISPEPTNKSELVAAKALTLNSKLYPAVFGLK